MNYEKKIIVLISLVVVILFFVIIKKCKKKHKLCHKLSSIREDFINFENNFEIKESKIQGVGIISKIKIPKNTVLFKCVENRVITPIGTKVNHCQIEKSNSMLIEHKNDWYLKSMKDIEIGDEITCDYNTTPRSLIARANPNWKC